MNGPDSMRALVVPWATLLIAASAAGQPVLEVSPQRITLSATPDTLFSSPGPVAGLSVGVPFGVGNVPFKYVGSKPASEPGLDIDFLIVSPSAGITPAGVGVALNPDVVPYLSAGFHQRILLFAPAAQPSSTATVAVTLSLRGGGLPSIASVVGAASLQPTISPGEIVSIFGSHLSTPPLKAKVSGAGLFPTALGNTIVTFNGINAPLLYVSQGQINCVVPYGVAGAKTVEIVVARIPNPSALSSPPFTLPLQSTSPGIFTLDQSGSGQGLIFNDPQFLPMTLNGANNPAPKGSLITLFATGAGLWNTPYQDGALVLLQSTTAGGAPSAPVSLTIGGQPAKLYRVFATLGQVSGMLQVDAFVPDGIDSGAQPLLLKVGDNDNSPQNVTVSVK